LVQLRARRFYPRFRDAIRPPALRADETTLPEPQENRKRAIRQDMPIARVAGDTANFAILVSLVMDDTTQSEFMQNTLFVL
jgi:hypothetical protein